MDMLKVSSQTRPRPLAGAIAGVVRAQGRVELQSVGPAAVNQAIKAVAIARDYLEGDGLDIVLIPSFVSVMIGDQERTAIKFIVEIR